MRRTALALAALAAAAAGCSPQTTAQPAPPCPTYREVSGVYVIDGQGPRPCLILPSTPLPTLRAQDYGITWRQPPHTSRTGIRPTLTPQAGHR